MRTDLDHLPAAKQRETDRVKAIKRDLDKATSPYGNRWAAIRCRNALLALCKSTACDLHNVS